MDKGKRLIMEILFRVFLRRRWGGYILREDLVVWLSRDQTQGLACDPSRPSLTTWNLSSLRVISYTSSLDLIQGPTLRPTDLN